MQTLIGRKEREKKEKREKGKKEKLQTLEGPPCSKPEANDKCTSESGNVSIQRITCKVSFCRLLLSVSQGVCVFENIMHLYDQLLLLLSSPPSFRETGK